MSEEQMIELAERVEKASGLDRELDRKIAGAVLFDLIDGWIDAPEYTASLDAAMSLVPEGWTDVRQHHHRMSDGSIRAYAEVEFDCGAARFTDEGKAATPALALTAACLRARAALSRIDGGGVSG